MQLRLLEIAGDADEQAEIDDVRPQIQRLVFDYERFLRDNPNFAPGYVSFALLLGSEVVDERRRAAALLLKANELDPRIALVKNQLGNYLAEEGKPLEAISYYLAAAEIEPDEPLYHYQIGLLLAVARSDFEGSGDWDSATITKTAHEALGRAYSMAPSNFEYGYRYAQSFYELPEPNWSAALEAWRSLEALSNTDLGRQAVLLQQANVRLLMGDQNEAARLLDRVTLGDLQAQREELRKRLGGLGDDASD